MKIIDLLEWDVTYDELVRWCLERNVDLYAISLNGGNGISAPYGFSKKEDLTAFTLTFRKHINDPMDLNTYF